MRRHTENLNTFMRCELSESARVGAHRGAYLLIVSLARIPPLCHAERSEASTRHNSDHRAVLSRTGAACCAHTKENARRLTSTEDQPALLCAWPCPKRIVDI